MTQSAQTSLYGYVPTEWICIVFVALFSVTSVIHLTQAVHYRLWWLLITPVLCGAMELCGWAARLWSSQDPSNLTPYIMQITSTIIAPTPLVAANFMILGELIRRLGSSYSRLGPRMYSIVFVSCDVISLVVQAVGGATAATALTSNDNPDMGGQIMLGGIAFQFTAITLYMILAAEFIWRRVHDKPVRSAGEAGDAGALSREAKSMIFGLYASSILIYLRSVYRLVELADGWTGEVIQTQWVFNTFDGGMIVLAMFELNVLHPGRILGPAARWNKRQEKEAGGSPAEAIRLRNKASHESGFSDDELDA